MATDQLERPGVYDDDGVGQSSPEPSFYTGAGSDDLEEGYAAPSADNDDLTDNHPSKNNNKSALDGRGLNREEVGNAQPSNNAMPGEQAAIGDASQWAAKGLSASGAPTGQAAKAANAILKALPKKNSSRGALGGLVAIVGSVATFIAISGPNVAINHFREIMLNKVSGVQTHQSVKYRRTKLSKIKDLFTTDGRRGGKIISEMEKNGYKFSYDGRKVIGMTPPGASSSLIGAGIGDHMDDFMEKNHPLKTARWKTSRSDALFKKFGVSRTSVVAKAAVEAGEDANKAVNKAMAKGVLPSPIPEALGKSPATDGESNDAKAAREAKDTAINGSQIAPDTEAGKLTAEIKDTGVDVANAKTVSKEFSGAAEDITLAANKEVIDVAEAAAKGSLGSRLWGGIKGFFNPTDILDNVCTLKNRLRMSVMVARNARAISMLKYAFVFIGAAEDVRRGNGNSGRVKSLMKRLMGTDKKGNNFAASPAYQFATKGKYNRLTNKSRKAQYGVDGTLNGTMGGIQNATDGIPGTSKTQCGVIQNPIFQIGSTVVVTIGKAALCIVSIGTGCAAEEGAEEAVKLTVRELVKKAVTESIENVFSKQAAKAVLKTVSVLAVATLTFEGAMALAQLYINQVLNGPFTSQEVGDSLAGPTIGGGSIANKQRSLLAGQVPVSGAQYAAARQTYLAELKEEQKSKSFYARIMDFNNPDSLAYSMVGSAIFNYNDTASVVNSGTQFMAKATSPLNVFTAVAKAVGGSAYAATDEEVSNETYVFERGTEKGKDIAVDFAGNPLVVMRTDIAAIDPETNAAELIASGDVDPTTNKPKSDAFKNHVTNCVENMDIISQIEFEDATKPEHDCMAKLSMTVKFKAHLAYLDLLDGVDAEFDPANISGDGLATNTSVDVPAIIPATLITGDTSNVPCGAGVDQGVADGYKDGKLIKIRLCKIQGHLNVNSQIAKGADDMFNAARAQGYNFDASDSFRTMDQQRTGFHSRCGASYPETTTYAKPPCTGAPIARPGYSNHQMGFALDMMCDGGGVPQSYSIAKNNRCFIWLQANAARYGFYEYGKGKETSRLSKNYEGWHWSVDGN